MIMDKLNCFLDTALLKLLRSLKGGHLFNSFRPAGNLGVLQVYTSTSNIKR